jgi:type IV secretion system protein VirD4
MGFWSWLFGTEEPSPKPPPAFASDKPYGGAQWVDQTCVSRDGEEYKTQIDLMNRALERPISKERYKDYPALDLGFFHRQGRKNPNYTEKSASILEYYGPRHLITIASTRSGKGATVILPNLVSVRGGYHHSVICIDPKGQNAAVSSRRRAMGRFKRNPDGSNSKEIEPFFCHLLNPYNEHNMGTSRFNPLSHLRITDPNIMGAVRGIGEALIIGDGDNSYFTDSARNLCVGLMLHLIETKPGHATLGEMRKLLTMEPPVNFRVELLSIIEGTKFPFIGELLGSFMGDTRDIISVINTARTQTAFLSDPSIQNLLSASDFNWLDLKKQKTTVYIILPMNMLIQNSRFFRLLIVSSLDTLTSMPGGRKVLFILDEFALLGHLSSIENAFGLAAGYNVQLWPFVQDLGQLKDIYKTRWESFLANAGVVQFFGINDTVTADFVSKRCGQSTIINNTINENEISIAQSKGGFSGFSTSTKQEGVPLIRPEECFGLDRRDQILFVHGLQNPVFGYRDMYNSGDYLGIDARFYDPDPFHS